MMHSAFYQAIACQPPTFDPAMEKIVGLLCTRFRVSRPSPVDGTYCLEIDQRRVSIERINGQERIFIAGEVFLGFLNPIELVKLGRMALSWAAGRGLCIGLHPDKDGVALVGYGIDSISTAPRDIESLYSGLRRVAGGMQALEQEFPSRRASLPRTGGQAASEARHRFNIMTRIEE